jgi:hypothetical protein
MRGTWQTTDSGGGGAGLGTALLVLAGAALAAKLAGPVGAAAAELVWVLGIVVAIIAGGAAVALMGGWAWRWRRRRLDAARTYPQSRIPVRAAPPLPQERQAPELPAASRRELPGGLHLHFHGVSAEDVAAIIERHHPDG